MQGKPKDQLHSPLTLRDGALMVTLLAAFVGVIQYLDRSRYDASEAKQRVEILSEMHSADVARIDKELSDQSRALTRIETIQQQQIKLTQEVRDDIKEIVRHE